MNNFERLSLKVNGVETVVYTIGKGEPLVYFHGAGTVDGFDFVEAFADNFRVFAPYHPGFGESGDDPTFTDLHDYVMHYLDLFDALNIDKFNLLGVSLGGYLAAKFASEHGHRVKRLALIAPAGLLDPDHPMLDFLAVPGEQIPALLVSNFEVMKSRLPEKPDTNFIADRYREATTVARLLWEHPGDPKFARYLHRVKMPTLIVWGDEDKMIPVQQTELWRRYIPHAEVKIYKGAGHLVHREKPEAVDAIARFMA